MKDLNSNKSPLFLIPDLYLHATEEETVLIRLMMRSQVVIVEHTHLEDGVVRTPAEVRNDDARQDLMGREIQD